MAQSPVFTHAFDFYYKWAPTGSSVITNLSWSQHYVSGSGPNKAMSGSWYNFPPFGVPVATGSILTRHTSSITDKDGALAWGSAASDLLWNVLTPSMSFSQALDGAGRADSIYRFTYNSESFLRKELLPSLELGVLTYPITSSWIAYEPRMIKYASGSTSTGYVVRGTALGVYFPASINSPATTVYSLPSAYTPPTTTHPRVGKNPTNITYGNNSTGSNDGRFFDLAGGCGITRASISASLVQFAASASGISNSEIAVCSAALKKRRLFFPTISTSSSSLATNNPSSWVRLALGKSSNQFFTENGGIYNVKFTLKRDITYDYYPDETQGSELLVYIHNVNAQVPSPSNRILGKNGWYPPEANIVRIKNTPAMAFENPDTGYKLETFNINVVQYGFPAQLVFEASGSLANDGYFGCIIDDVEFCKVGVTTDPGLIKPLNFVDTNTAEYFATKGAVAQPPAPLTGEQQAQQVLLDQANAAAATAQGFATAAEGFATTAGGHATTAGNVLIAVNQASGSAKDEINTAKDAAVSVINIASGSAKDDINTAKDAAVSNVNTAKDAAVSVINILSGSAKDDINTAKDAGVLAINVASGSGVLAINVASGSAKDDINTAKDTAVGAINTASGSAKTDINTAKDAAVGAINTASGSGVLAINVASGSAKDDINTAKDTAITAIYTVSSSIKTDINTAKDAAVGAINTASGSGVLAINQASGSGVLAINVASGSAKTEITSAKDTAITAIYEVSSSVSSSIAGFVVQAKGFKDDADTAATSAKGFSTSAQGFATAAQASASAASGFKDTASTSATAAAASASVAKGFATAAAASASVAKGFSISAKGFATAAEASASSAAGYASTAVSSQAAAAASATIANTHAENAADEAGAAASEASSAAASATKAAASASKAAISAATASKAVTSASLFVYSGSIYMSQSFAYASQSWSTVKGTTASTLYNTTARNAVAARITAASSSYAAIKLAK